MTILALLGLGDEAVVQTATQLGETVAVLIESAPPPKEHLSALGKAGVARVIHIWEPALSEHLQASLERELTTVALLTSLLRKIDFTTLVVGDDHSAWLAPALAEDLDLPHLTSALSAVPVEPSAGKDDILVQRRCLQGIQRLRGPARCVLAVLPTGPSPTLALPRPSRQAPRLVVPSVETWNLARLGLELDDLPRPLLKLQQPERVSPLSGLSFDTLPELADRLRHDGLAPYDSFVPSVEVDALEVADDLVIDGAD